MSEISQRLESDPEFAKRFQSFLDGLKTTDEAKPIEKLSEIQLRLEELELTIGRYSPNDSLKSLVKIVMDQEKQIQELKLRLDHVHDRPNWISGP